MQNEWTLNTMTMGNISKEDPCRIHSELDGVDGGMAFDGYHEHPSVGNGRRWRLRSLVRRGCVFYFELAIVQLAGRA